MIPNNLTDTDIPASMPASAKPAVPLWHSRDFLLLSIGQAISNVGSGVSGLALPLLVLAITHSPAQAGLVTALEAVPPLLLNLPAGALVDRLDRKRLMLVCDLIRGLNLAAVPLALALGRLTLLHLCLFALIEGACAVFYNLANIACLPRLVAKAQLPAAVAQREVTEGTVMLLGPSLGGVLFAAGRVLPFLADAVSYAASIFTLLFIRTPFQGELATTAINLSQIYNQIREGMLWLWRHRLMRFMALIYGLLALTFSGGSLCVIVIAQQRGASSVTIGFIFALGGIGGILGALLGPYVQRRFSFGRILPVLHWVYALLWPLEIVMPLPLLMGVVEAFFMINDQVYDVVWPSYRIASIPDALQGRVTSAFRLLSYTLRPVGLALTGFLIQSIGAVNTMLIWGACIAAIALLVTLNPDVRHAP
ncbi:MAG: MFS transporter, partial [Ktedonobacterales bacterium]